MATYRLHRPAGRNQWVLVALFLVALVFTGFFAHRLFGRRPPPLKGEPIRGWMTINYVAHSYRVPPPVLYRALDLPPAPPDRRPLRNIARVQGRTMDEVRELLLAAIVEARAAQPPALPPKKEATPLAGPGGEAR